MTHYHVSKHKNITELEPHVPGDGALECEPDVARVCAAPTIFQCLVALAETDLECAHYAYEIDAAPDVNNYNVINWPNAPEEWKRWGDAADTGEVWYLAPVKCQMLGTVNCFGEVTQ